MRQPSADMEQPETALVLVADDDAGIRQVLRCFLEQDGFRVAEAADGHEAIQFCNNCIPDLVLLDARMPVMDGFACCRHLCEAHSSRSIPIMILTALNDEESVVRAFDAGATDYWTKPVNWVVLRQRVRRLLQQSRLMRQIKVVNQELDRYTQTLQDKIREQTAQLEQALHLETTLKHITDRVRDSLDERVILQTAVQELSRALGLGCCNASIYDSEQRISIVRYEHSTSIPGYQDRAIQMDDYPEIYHQLLQGETIQFCSLSTDSWRSQVALFAFPIKEEEVMGDLWLVSQTDRVLGELEVRLVQQVTNQCAIAIRQARLYQAVQQQVCELEHLNQLKDDFLSTVSHELRTPVTNMRVAIQLLERFMPRNLELSQGSDELFNSLQKSNQYLQILHSECDREINLINDLLDLQRLETGQQVASPVPFALHDWLSNETDTLVLRAQARQQVLHLNLAASLPTIEIDPLHLQRILMELVNNACKYSPMGATITLDAQASADHLIVSVTNTGVTIPEQERERVFDKFYRVSGGDRWKQGGTGLGLALVKRLVELAGGTIRVICTENDTCFVVEFPVEPLPYI